MTVQCIGVNHSAGVPAPGVIGRPFGTTRTYILDESMNVLPVGVIGELCLAGNQVGRGYLDMPEETSRVFIPDPFHHGGRMYRSGDLARWTSDGFIEYIGRRNGGFVKLHGLRIDVGEVEAALMLTEKTFAVVELVELEGESHLVAFLSHKLAPPGETPVRLTSDPVALREWIKGLLATCRLSIPSYAVPTLWIALEAMPQANSNKVDRKQLRQLFARLSSEKDRIQSISRALLNIAPPRPPQDAFEEILLSLWTQILETDDISVHDDFFSIGGNSIRSVVFLSRVQRYGWTITLQEFRRAGTIARIAELVKSKASSALHIPESISMGGLVVQIQHARSAEETARSPIWFIHDGAGFIGRDCESSISVLSRRLVLILVLDGMIGHLGREVYGISNPSINQLTLESNYPTFDSFSTQYMPLIPSDQAVYLAGWSSGGNVALDIAAKRLARGMPVKGVILLDTMNTEGWKLRIVEPTPGFERGELMTMHLIHTKILLQQVVEPRCDFPVLLIRAGSEHPMAVPGVWEHRPLPEKGTVDMRHERNFFTTRNVPFMETVTLDKANHMSLFSEEPYRQITSDIIRQWCQQPPA